MNKKNVTLKTIAELAGVSRVTVSQILNTNTATPRASRETCERVRRIARELNYQPNLIAQTLTNGSSRIIGVLLDSMASGYSLALLGSIEEEASRHGYRVMVGIAHDSPERFHNCYQLFRQYHVAGVISMAHTYPGREADIIANFAEEKNIVYIFPPPFPAAACVEVDVAAGIEAACAHLRANGASRLGMLSEDGVYPDTLARLEAFRRCEPGGHIEFIAPSDRRTDEQHGSRFHRAVEQLIEAGIDGLITMSDLWAAAAAGMMARRGIAVPGDIKLVGLGNSPICDYSEPALSSIDMRAGTVAGAAVEMLLNLVADKSVSPVVITPELVRRGSSGAAGI